MAVVYFVFILFYLFIFRQRRRKIEREGEKRQYVVASHTPLLETWPATQACALTENRTGDPLLHRPVLNPLSYTSQGHTQDLTLNSELGNCCSRS